MLTKGDSTGEDSVIPGHLHEEYEGSQGTENGEKALRHPDVQLEPTKSGYKFHLEMGGGFFALICLLTEFIFSGDTGRCSCRDCFSPAPRFRLSEFLFWSVCLKDFIGVLRGSRFPMPTGTYSAGVPD